MNGPFQIAQANIAGQSGGKPPARIVKVAKPFSEQSVVVALSYDGSVKADLSAIAGEKITLVHIGEKLIILFDNKSTVTLEPFFDSTGKPLNGISVEVSPGRDLTGAEFAATFPVTEDQSVLPAAGDGTGGNAQASGANFSSVGVDPLALPGPLALLGQEELPNFVINDLLGPNVEPDRIPFQIAGAHVGGVIEEEQLGGFVGEKPSVQELLNQLNWITSGGKEDTNDNTLPNSNGTSSDGLDRDTPEDPNVTTQFFHGAGADALTNLVGSGNPPLTFTIDTGIPNSPVIDSTGAVVKSGNHELHYSAIDTTVAGDNTIVGGYNDGENGFHEVFRLTIHSDGTYDFELLDKIDHPVHTTDTGSASNGHLEETLFLDFTTLVHVSDVDGDNFTLSEAGAFTIGVIDDTPEVHVSAAEESSLKLAALDESIGLDLNDSNAAIDDTNQAAPKPFGEQKTGDLSLADLFSVSGTTGEDGGTADYSFTLTLGGKGENGGVATSLSVTDPNHVYADAKIYLFSEGTDIVGRVGGPQGDIALRVSIENPSDPVTAHFVVDQYLPIDHGLDNNNFDTSLPLILSGDGTLGITLTATVTDGDGDVATSTATVTVIDNETTLINIEDDGPTVTAGEGGEIAPLAVLDLDETIDTDRYNTGETESNGGASNGADDKSVTVTVSTDQNLAASKAIGELSTGSGALAGLFTSPNIDFGTDGPGANGGITKHLDLVLSSEHVGTSLTATALVGTSLANMTAAQRAIELVQLDSNTIVGRLVGDGNPATEDQYIAFRITLTNADDPANAKITVDQFLAIDHGGSESPSVFDEQTLLTLIGNSTLNLKLTTIVTDGDGDHASLPVEVTLIGGNSSFIAFDDDGPTVTVSKAEGFTLVHDETLLLQSPPFGDDNDILFTPVFNSVSNPGHDPDVPFGLPIGYARSAGSALSAPVISYGMDGAAAGAAAKVYSLSLFDANGALTSGPIDSKIETTDHHEIFLFKEGNFIVGRYDTANGEVTNADPAAFALYIDPATGVVSLVQYVSLHHNSPDAGVDSDEYVSLGNALGSVQATVTVTDGDGDKASASANISGDIRFEDDGPSVAVTVQHGFGVTADESTGNQSDDVPGPLAIFASVTNVGHDPDNAGNPLAFATDNTPALAVLPYFGVDGPATVNPVAYSLTLNGGNGTPSGLKITDGTTISLYTDPLNSNIIVGRVDSGPLAGQAAFAVAIDPLTGQVSVVEYLSLQHNLNGANPNDQVTLASNTILATVTITDGDGDTAFASADISGKIHFNDDGPTLTVATDVSSDDLAALALNLDETIGKTGSPADHYNTGETESGGGAQNGVLDDTSNKTVTLTTDSHSTAQISELKSSQGSLNNLFAPAIVNYGADGPSANPLTSALSLVLTGTAGAGYKTNLVATALTGGPLAGTSVDHRTVWLTVEDGQIVGRIGHDTAGTGDDYVVLRISLSSTDPATAQLIVDQFLPIDHDASEPAGSQAPENPSLFDETISLLMANTGQGIGVKLTVTATDGDNDSVTKSATANIVSSNTSIVSFDDDGPTPAIAATNGAANGLFFDGFVSNSPQWGEGSGINSTGTAGAWHIAASDYEGASTIQLERVGDGYRGADSPTNSVMVDMEATPGNIQLTQDLTLTPGTLYHLTFEIGAAIDPGIANSAKLEVFWNGVSQGTFIPLPGLMQTISIDVTSAGANNQLTFMEVGEAGDNTGTFLANVKLSDVIIIDETKGVDPDSDDITGIGALFATVTNGGPVGVDPNMDQPQYAQGKDPVVVTGVADYGTDGPAAVDPRVIGLNVSSAGVYSGLTTTEGKEIHLYLEGKLVVGRFDSDNNGSYDTAAFALSIDPNTGILSIAQYVSLHHPIAGQNDEGVYLNANTLLATVTLTDGDGDHATSSADISSAVRFEDDGPSINPLENSSLRDWTIDEDVLPAAGHTTPVGNDALDNPADSNDYTLVANKPLGVTWGADGPKSLTFAAADSHHPTVLITDGNGTPQPALTSGGIPLVYDIQTNLDGGQTLIAYKGSISPANQIFTLTLDPDAGTGGTFSFELTGALDHPTGNGQNTLNLQFGFTATDGDDDTATSTLTFRITDDVPYLTNPYQNANLILNGSFEDHGPVGNPGFNTFQSIDHWTSGPDNVPFEIQQGNIGDLPPQDGSAKVELDSDPLNNPTSQLNATIQQTISTALNAGDSFELSFWYSPRPNDGNPDSSSLKVYWNGVVVHTIDSSTQPDGWQHVSILVTAQAGSNTVAFQGDGQANQLGAYIDNVSLIPAITVDEDGLTGPLAYGNHDSQPGDNVVPNTEGAGQDNNEATATGNLNIKWGADDSDSGVDTVAGPFSSFVQDHPDGLGDRSVTFTNANVAVTGVSALYSHGDLVTFVLNADHTVLYGVAGTGNSARTVFEVSLSDEGTGQFRFILLDKLDHAPGANENDIGLSFNYTATDSDGDAVSGSFFVGVDDDVPVVNGPTTTVTLDDEAQPNGIDGGPGDLAGNNYYTASGDLNFSAGADGLKSIAITGFSAKNSNGDTAVALFAIYVDPTTGMGKAYEVTTTWAAGVNAGVGGAAGDFTKGGTFTGTMTVPDGNGTKTVTVFTIEVDSSGHYTVTLDAPLSHPFTDPDLKNNGPELSYEDELTLNFNYQVTDGDNDQATGTLSVKVDDDSPELNGIQQITVDSYNVAHAGDIDFNPGADGAGNANLAGNVPPAGMKAGGQDVHYWVSEDGSTLIAYTGAIVTGSTPPDAANQVFMLEVTDGEQGYTFTQYKALDLTASTSQIIANLFHSNAPAPSIDVTTASNGGNVVATVMGSGDVNGSAQGFGLHSNNFNPGDWLKFDFTQSDPTVATFSFFKDTPLNYVVLFSDGNSLTVTNYAATSALGLTITAPVGVTIVAVEFDANSDSNKTKIDLDSVKVGTTSNSADTDLAFTANLTDGDGDGVAGTINVHIHQNTPPTITVTPTTGETNVATGHNLVDEAGLPTVGSNASAPSEVTHGTFTLTDTDGAGDIKTVTITGVDSSGPLTVALNGSGATVHGTYGTLVISANPVINGNTVTYSYTYTLTAPYHDPSPVAGQNIDASADNFTITVTDGSNTTSNATLTVDIKDDVPQAKNDGSFGVVEDGAGAANTPPTSHISGNVLSNDVPGADGLTGAVTWAAGNAAEVAELGTYGTLQLNANGTWSFDLNNSLATTQALIAGQVKTYTLDYTITDNDGDTSPATLTITITGSNDTPTLTVPEAGGVGTLVDEAGLPARTVNLVNEPAGSDASSNSEITSGSFSYTNGDGASTVTINGQALASGANYTGAHGILHIDSIVGTTVNYTYTLTDNVDNDTETPTDSFAIHVADSDGNPADDASANLVINIVDDAPVANVDADAVAAGFTSVSKAAAAGVLSNDTLGADGASVVGVAKGTTNANLDNTGTLGGTGLHGTYGTLTLNADGSYTYVRDANSAGGGTDTFTYTIKDGDGDLSHTTLTITLPDAKPSYTLPTAGDGVTTVYEAGLAVRSGEPAGSHIGATNITATGVIGVTSVDGVGSVSLNGVTVTGTSAGTANTVLSNSTGTLTAWYEAATSQIHYTYTLLDNTISTTGTSINVPVGVTDLDGDTPASGGNLVINIVDDAPVAVSDTNSLGTAAVGSHASGNLIAGTISSGTGTGGVDTQGADGAHIGGVTGGVSDGSGGFNVTGTYGTLHIGANGSYDYTRTSSSGGTDTFHYTLTDGDGDISNQADLTITLAATAQLFVGSNDSDDNPSDPAHYVDTSSNVRGVINGSAGDDTIVGDPGATPTISAGASANVVLVLDTTASLSAQQMTAMQQAVGALLNSLYNSGAADVRVALFVFGGGYKELGVFDIVSGSTKDLTALNNALDAANADGSINNTGKHLYIGSDPGSNTSYASGLDAVIDYLTPGGTTVATGTTSLTGDGVAETPLANASVNKVIFISDGEPTTNATQTQINTITGTSTGQYGYTIEAVGLDVAGSPNAVAALNALDSGHAYTNVQNPGDLTGVVGSLAGSGVVQSAAGNDIINGGAGKDIIYGDVMNTDVLRAAAGLSAATYPAGSGWAVFAALEGTTSAFTTANDPGGDGAQWTRADTLAYIATHQRELATESGRTGGDDTITGGTGDDIIFAQEGNDKIYYAQGDGKDTVDGGTGSDTLYITGATGTVTIAAAVGGTDIVPATGPNNTDIIVTMSDGGTIRMDSVEDIDITAGPGGVNIQYIGSLASTALDTSTVTVHGGTGDDILDLTARSNSDPHKVIADGGAQTTADIVKLDFSISEITAIEAIAGGVKITHAGGSGTITDEFTNFESFQFEGGVTKNLAGVLAIDLTPPTLTSITMNDTALKIGETAIVTVVFSEKVTNLEIADFTAPNGSLSNLSSSDGGQTWTMTFAPSSGNTSTGNQISLANSSYTDISGNAGSGGASATTYAVDTVAPTVTSIVTQNPSSSTTSADTLIFRVTFSEAVNGVDAADFSVSGTTAGISVAAVGGSGGTQYDVTVSGGNLANLNGAVSLAFAGGQNITDAAGNALASTTPTGTDNHTYTVDNAAPTLSNLVVTDTNIQFDVSEAVTVTGNGTATVTNVSNHITLTPGATGTSSTVVLTDAAGNAANAFGLYVGTSGNNGSSGTPISAPLASGTNVMYGYAGTDFLTGGSGVDYIFGGDGADTIDGNGGADKLSGGAGNDIFQLANNDWVAGESIDGGADSDTILLTNGTTVDFTNGTISSVETLNGSSSVDSVTMSAQQWAAFSTINLNGSNDTLTVKVDGAVDISGASSTTVSSAETRNVEGGNNNDTLTISALQLANLIGGTTNKIDLGGGTDTIILSNATTADLSGVSIISVENLKGSSSNDSITLTAAQLTALASLDLGGGTGDTLTLTTAPTNNMSNVTNVENLVLANLVTNVTTVDSLVAAGATLTVSGTTSAALTWNGSAETNGAFNITGGSGNDQITGGAGDDTITSGSGNDTLKGGGGSDTFILGANLTSADTIDGGSGNDTLTFTGSTSNTTALNNVTNVETIVLGNASTSITTVDGLVAAGQTLTVDGSALASGSVLTWNGAAETNGKFIITGGAGNDVITGGAGNDVITGGAGADTLTGGAGSDTFVINDGDSTAVTAAGTSGNQATRNNNGTITGYDVINDWGTGGTADKLDFGVAPIAVSNVGTSTHVDGINSSLTISSSQVGYHSISNGMVTFYNASNTTISLAAATSSNIAAVVEYLQSNDLGNAGATVAFVANGSTYVYQQTTDNTGLVGGSSLVQLAGITSITNLNSLIGAASAIDPIVLDLDHNGFAFTSAANGVQFDLNHDGAKDQIAWVKGQDGLLALDINGNGQIDNGSELFTPTFAGGNFASGLAALASLDSNNDGVIDSKDQAFAQLSVWQDINHNGVTDAGELLSLTSLGITGIDLNATSGTGAIDGQNVASTGRFTYADGSKGSFVEVDLDAFLGDVTDGDHAHTLTGTNGVADTFAVPANVAGHAETILNFNNAEGDKIDLSALLDQVFAPNSDVDKFVHLTQSGNDVTVQVDTTGQGNFEGGSHNVAVLAGFAGTSHGDIINATFAGTEHQLHLAATT